VVKTSKILAFARFLESFDFRFLQQYRHQTDVAVATVDVCFVENQLEAPDRTLAHFVDR
jgi:hypothetical protein